MRTLTTTLGALLLLLSSAMTTHAQVVITQPDLALGSQLIFVNFKDPASLGSTVTFATNVWSVVVSKGEAGQPVVSLLFGTGGVDERNVVDFFGDAANGAPGGAAFVNSESPVGVSRLIFFVQSLGTFGTGYLLPSG